MTIVVMLTACGKVNVVEPIAVTDNYRTTYEVFIYSYCDSNGDGIGDIKGLTSKLNYIAETGFNAIWLMPIMPSPSYHKYDVINYMDIDPSYGTMSDFDEFISEAHNRNIDVYIDFVMNHTSTEHPWFVDACNYLKNLDDKTEPSVRDCPYVEYYNFKEEADNGYAEVPGTNGRFFYEARFWEGMPDVNLESEKVREEYHKIADFWLDKGVDGFRLDACTSYVTGNDEKNIQILSDFVSYVKEKKPDAYIVSEVWADSSTYAKYLQSGEDSTFAFDFSQDDGVIAKTLNNTKAQYYGEMLMYTQEKLLENNPEYIDAPFYVNHDLARSAGFYAGEGSVEKTKLGWAMSLLMSGNTFLYYGEEIGMKGNGDDENKRTPMRWTEDENSEGTCKSIATKEIKQKFDSLESQQADESSLYNFIKSVIAVRNSSPVISHGKYVGYSGTDEYVIVKKEFDGKKAYLCYNISEKNLVVDNPSEAKKIYADLETGEKKATLDKGQLCLPAYSVVLLLE